MQSDAPNDIRSVKNFHLLFHVDPYQLDYDAEHVPAIKCKYTCDDHASCGCGLLSGRYVCICHAGYYGTGEAGKCTREYTQL